MSDEAPQSASTAVSKLPAHGAHPKVRADDRRGGGAPGRLGNPPFEPTTEQRKRVRDLAKSFPPGGEHYIAALIGIHKDTLRKYFSVELTLGRAEVLASIAAQMMTRALDGGAEVAKGDLDAQKFVLARFGGWSAKIEHTGEGGGPIETVDLSLYTPDQLREYGRLVAIQRGLDPSEADVIIATLISDNA